MTTFISVYSLALEHYEKQSFRQIRNKASAKKNLDHWFRTETQGMLALKQVLSSANKSNAELCIAFQVISRWYSVNGYSSAKSKACY